MTSSPAFPRALTVCLVQFESSLVGLLVPHISFPFDMFDLRYLRTPSKMKFNQQDRTVLIRITSVLAQFVHRGFVNFFFFFNKLNFQVTFLCSALLLSTSKERKMKINKEAGEKAFDSKEYFFVNKFFYHQLLLLCVSLLSDVN